MFIFILVMMAKSSVDQYSKSAMTNWTVVFNCHGPVDPTPPNSALVLFTLWIEMHLSVLRLTTKAKLVWDTNKNSVTVSLSLSPLWSMLRTSTLVDTRSDAPSNWRPKLLDVISPHWKKTTIIEKENKLFLFYFFK